ncbi:hypothetical protein C0Q70_13072 [Pomacea canaliculata]|uniref:Peptidase M14 domain-containing protein n=1 Tax=Pomacea canaliculata TaxID=400727 RepID=A0A2T7NW86_POMCA|nr:hypothetical protein C0Q70_13072 [Pomacea canaliculata]
MANPDGRSYIESSQNFCWRGTSRGVDLNRNFDWQFAKSGSSNDPEDEEYRGPLPFSEPECNVYIHLTSLMHFDAFISFHSGIRRIYMPFADTASKTMRRIPYNNHHMEMLSTRLSSVTQYRFKFGKAYDLNLYPADGTIFDYMAGVQQIPFSLAVELWGNEEHTGLSCFDEFNPPSHNLQTEVEAIHPLYVELFSYLDFWKQQQTQNADSLYVVSSFIS